MTITSNDGCSSNKVVVVQLNKEIQLPNVFSPNNDGINDFWDLSSLYNLKGVSVQVFDRGGTIVFQSHLNIKNWDGRNNGQPVPIGTYYYIINIPNYKQISGSITILR